MDFTDWLDLVYQRDLEPDDQMAWSEARTDYQWWKLMARGTPRFYFTTHPGDMLRGRLIEGCCIMAVAAAHWDDERKRFRINRPPADHITSMCIDSGGFTAARRWGRYPWTVWQYVDFIREMSRDVPLDFCAIMDYACEPSVDRSIYASNISRIEVTIQNEVLCRDVDPELPWLAVLQGDSFEERSYDLETRRRAGMLPDSYAGIGSVCGRGARGAIRTTLFYRDRLPGVKFHGFGMHIQALDDDQTFATIQSWDSYGWNWGKGQKDVDRPPEYLKRPDESFSDHNRRLGQLYWRNTILPRLTRSRQGVLI